MLSFRLRRVLVFAFLYYVHSQRRIQEGFDVKTDKPYMVYLVQAVSSIRNYSAWICGGSIVSRFYILTSAACVEDVQSMYAIAGSRSYVSSWNIFSNTCTQNTKKKVVYTCVPKEYALDFGKVESWSFNDIAVVKVETPYDSQLELYQEFCNYKPTTIKINFDVKNEQAGKEVIVLGYGHKNFWREINGGASICYIIDMDLRICDYDFIHLKEKSSRDIELACFYALGQSSVSEDWNSLQMQYSSTKIKNLDTCKNMYKSPDLFNNIDKFMICTNGSGSIDETGKARSSLRLGKTHQVPNFKARSRRKNNNSSLNLNTRRQGFCQNDHGGPLVAWIDGVETVIGVASVFRVNKERKCTGPYLYTSTARNKMFIECIITDQMSRRSNLCDKPASELGFSISRRYVLWDENENHVADTEEIRIRPQINMNFIGMG